MRQPGKRRWLRITLVIAATLAVAAYLARDTLFFAFLYRGSRADWALDELYRERHQVSREIWQLDRSGLSELDLDAAKEGASIK